MTGLSFVLVFLQVLDNSFTLPIYVEYWIAGPVIHMEKVLVTDELHLWHIYCCLYLLILSRLLSFIRSSFRLLVSEIRTCYLIGRIEQTICDCHLARRCFSHLLLLSNTVSILVQVPPVTQTRFISPYLVSNHWRILSSIPPITSESRQ